MYALLTCFLVNVGSMGTGEDLFYKCCAPSEEMSINCSYKKLFLENGTITSLLSFSLKKYFISLDLVIEIIPVILIIG